MVMPLTIAELPKLKEALDLMGLDIGGSVIAVAIVPEGWEARCRAANDELVRLTDEEMETFTQGEETAMLEIAKRAPNAHDVLNAAFDDGELAEIVFQRWTNIFDARDAENRVARERSRLRTGEKADE